MIQITAIRMENGERHQDITAVMWKSTATFGAIASSQAIVDWLCAAGDNRAVIATDDREVTVEVVNDDGHEPHLRTRENGAWTDHLLKLPRF